MYHIYSFTHNNSKVVSLVIEAEIVPNKVISIDGVSYLTRDNKLIGVNFFDKNLSIKDSGLEKFPSKELIDEINVYLVNKGFPKLDYVSTSGFIVMEVSKIEEHPLNAKLDIVSLKGLDKEYSTVTRYKNIKVGDHVVATTDGASRLNCSLFVSRVERNIPIDVELNSPLDLGLGDDYKNAYISDLPIGSDIFR